MTRLVQISIEDYFTGPDGVRRDLAYAGEMTPQIYDNALATVGVVNSVLAAMFSDGISPGVVVKTGLCVASGWRPRGINEHTSNAAEHSTHLRALGCDIEDTLSRELARWALENETILRSCGVLGMERPQWTPHWLHIQTVPAASGHFVYIPSSAAPLIAALPMEVTA